MASPGTWTQRAGIGLRPGFPEAAGLEAFDGFRRRSFTRHQGVPLQLGETSRNSGLARWEGGRERGGGGGVSGPKKGRGEVQSRAQQRRVRTAPPGRRPALSAPTHPASLLRARPQRAGPKWRCLWTCGRRARSFRGEAVFQGPALGAGSAAPRSLPVHRPTRRPQGSGVLAGQLPASPEVAAAVRVGRAGVGLGCPRTPHDLAHTRAHTLTPCGISRPGPRLWEGPAASPGSTERGRQERRVPARVEAVSPFPAPFGAWAWPPRFTPRPAGVPEAPGRAAGGKGVRVGAAGSGPRGGWAPRRGKFGRGKLPPRPPRREEGAHGGRHGHPGSPCGRRLAPRAARPAAPRARGLPPAGQPPLGGDPAAPSRGTQRAYLGERPGAPPSCRLGALRGAGAPGAGGRASPEPGGARRSRRESGRESGSRGGECARV